MFQIVYKIEEIPLSSVMAALLFTATRSLAVSPAPQFAEFMWIELQHVINHVNNSVDRRKIQINDAHLIYVHSPAPGISDPEDSASHGEHGEMVTKERPVAELTMNTTRVQCSVHHVMFKNFCQLFRESEKALHGPRGFELQFSEGPVRWREQS